MWHDLRFAVRGLMRRPGFTALAVLTLTLGLGANVAIFSVVDGVVLRPLPYEAPDRLVRLSPESLFPNSLEDALFLEEHASSLASVAAWGRALFLLGGEQPEEVRGALVDAGHFAVLGAPPMLGSGFRPEHGLPDAERVVILGHGLWQRRFGGDPSVVGRQIEVSGRSTMVVGVLGPRHQPIESDWQVWAPLRRDPEAFRHRPLAINARLAEGASLTSAQDEVRSLLLRSWRERGGVVEEGDGAEITLVPLRKWLLGEADRSLLFLLGAVGLVLLIACVNVGNLLLARGSGRSQELSVRMAIGAGRGRLVRLLLAESLLLGTLGGALGLLVGGALLRFGLAYLPAELPRSHAIVLDLRVLAFTAVISLVASALFGLAPAWRLARGADLGLRTRVHRGPSNAWLAQGLIAAEVAMAVMVVAGAGVMVKSFTTLMRVDPGFEPARVVTVKPSPPRDRYGDPERLGAYYDEVFDAVAAVPGVEAVGGIQFLPMKPGGRWSSYSPSRRREPNEDLPGISLRTVTPGYFDTMGIPLYRGRDVDAGDRPDTEAVMLVNRALADAVWPGEDPVGKSLFIGRDEPSELKIVGVVGNVRQRRLDEPSVAEGYLPFGQSPWGRMYVTARVAGDAERAVPFVREAVLSVDSGVSVGGAGTLDQVVGGTVEGSRFLTALLSGFGVLALLLGAVGVYGVTAQAVISRRREFGIRMSLGARPQDVLRQALGRGLRPIFLGLAAGLLGWMAVSRSIEGLLYEVAATDTLVLAQVSCLLAAVSIGALAGPARRAGAVDPMAVLREE